MGVERLEQLRERLKKNPDDQRYQFINKLLGGDYEEKTTKPRGSVDGGRAGRKSRPTTKQKHKKVTNIGKLGKGRSKVRRKVR